MHCAVYEIEEACVGTPQVELVEPACSASAPPSPDPSDLTRKAKLMPSDFMSGASTFATGADDAVKMVFVLDSTTPLSTKLMQDDGTTLALFLQRCFSARQNTDICM